jgi:flagellar secretion chaperone FliS
MTPTPVQLIIMLYDGLIRFLTNAHDGFSEPNSELKAQLISTNITRSQQIISELQRALNTEKGGNPAQHLSNLYSSISTLLYQFNATSDPAILLSIRAMIQDVRDGWVQIDSSSETEDKNLSTQAA